MNISQILEILKEEHEVHAGQSRSDPISVLVQTILSQNTSDINSRSAFASLISSFGSWGNVADADVDAVEHAIRHGGLGRVKAVRIKQALKEIKRKRGRLELDFLKQLKVFEAKDWLVQLPGVGVKTASCVLLFSLGMPALPVDTHVLRVAKRLGLISFRTTLEGAHKLLGELVPVQEVYQFHVLLIEHGRKVCRAQRPLCRGCILKEICSSYVIFAVK
ncbi:endonuclease III domain-containing protein [Chloroflexota bacterium]